MRPVRGVSRHLLPLGEGSGQHAPGEPSGFACTREGLLGVTPCQCGLLVGSLLGSPTLAPGGGAAGQGSW